MHWLVSSALLVLLVALSVRLAVVTRRNHASQLAALEALEQARSILAEKQALQEEVIGLRPFVSVRDAAAEAQRLKEEAAAIRAAAEADAAAFRQRMAAAGVDARSKIDRALALAKSRADELVATATAESARLRSVAEAEADALRREGRTANVDAKARAERVVADAHAHADSIVNEAKRRAEDIAGDAYRALQESEELKSATVAMKNVIDGYGDRYLVPTFSLLDELGEAYGFDDAGRALSAARELTRSLIASGRAAECSYAEANRRATALRFVLDAFNGKVDTVLAKVKAENAGTLGQQIRDAFALVNLNGKAFRDARITPEYLNARLAELKAAASVQALREREREEQRRIREQIREEEKARREIERALKEAAKEEEALQRALDKVRLQVAKASDEQRAAFEAKLAELQCKLSEAESRNRRALSMAQQTKAGHVYVISNVGSFGENVLKVGMTRRLEPQDRIRELGDASVPFEFDVHAMLWTEDAPALERELHRRFVRSQVNKVNPRKEFFRVSVAELKTCVEGLGLETTWTVTAAAAQYRETLAIERALKEGAAIAQHWIRDQMAFEPELDGVANDTMTATGAPA